MVRKKCCLVDFPFNPLNSLLDIPFEGFCQFGAFATVVKAKASQTCLYSEEPFIPMSIPCQSALSRLHPEVTHSVARGM